MPWSKLVTTALSRRSNLDPDTSVGSTLFFQFPLVFAAFLFSFSQYNGGNCEPLFVPGGFAMWILVPWKPVVLVWGLLSAMIFFGFVASSVLEGKDPFAPGATITQPSLVKAGVAQVGQQPKHPQKPARTPSQ